MGWASERVRAARTLQARPEERRWVGGWVGEEGLGLVAGGAPPGEEEEEEEEGGWVGGCEEEVLVDEEEAGEEVEFWVGV